MKYLKLGVFLALLTAGYSKTSAQSNALPVNEPDYNKPKIFTDLPNKINARIADLEDLLRFPVGAQVNVPIATGFQLTGMVVSKSNPSDPSVQSIVIKSPVRQGATLTFTRIKNADGSYPFIGRMMSRNAGDALEIVKEGTTYVIRKKGLYDIVNE